MNEKLGAALNYIQDLWNQRKIPGSSTFFFFFCFYMAGGVWKSGIMLLIPQSTEKTPQSTEKKKLFFSVSNTSFFQKQGKTASLPGCDLPEIRQCPRPVPSRAKKQNSPLHTPSSMRLAVFMKHVMNRAVRACQPMISAQGRRRKAGKNVKPDGFWLSLKKHSGLVWRVVSSQLQYTQGLLLITQMNNLKLNFSLS